MSVLRYALSANTLHGLMISLKEIEDFLKHQGTGGMYIGFVVTRVKKGHVESGNREPDGAIILPGAKMQHKRLWERSSLVLLSSFSLVLFFVL